MVERCNAHHRVEVEVSAGGAKGVEVEVGAASVGGDVADRRYDGQEKRLHLKLVYPSASQN